MVAKMAKIGIVPGQDFDIDQTRPGRGQGPGGASPRRRSRRSWPTSRSAGHADKRLDVHDQDRASTAPTTCSGPASPPSAWAPTGPRTRSIPTSEVDADGKPYDGANKYVMHFDKGQTPPAKGFWSLTMYDAEYFFVANPLNRYTLSSRNEFKPTRTARWTSTSRTSRRARTRRPTGCRPRRASSS